MLSLRVNEEDDKGGEEAKDVASAYGSDREGDHPFLVQPPLPVRKPLLLLHYGDACGLHADTGVDHGGLHAGFIAVDTGRGEWEEQAVDSGGGNS